MHFNDLLVTGNLTREPEPVATKSGGMFCKFGIAHNTRIKKGEEWVDGPPMFLDCVVFGDQAERFVTQAQKGSSVTLEGALSYETWEAKDGGGKRSKHTMKVNRFSVDKKGRELSVEEGEGELVGAAAGGPASEWGE